MEFSFRTFYCIYNQREMQKYKTIKTLGDGAFGTVYKATNIKTGEVVAIKKMKQKYTNWNECIQLRQIKSLRKLNHSNIIKLKEVLLVAEQLYMVFEYLDYNLYEVYSKMKEEGKKFTQKQIKNMVFQIASGLASMHKNGFFHRDMKPQNLLIYNNTVKVCDLGLAREIRSRPPFTDYVSTRWYRAPQLLLRSTNYNSPVDIFALGCIMAELYTFCPLFPGTNEVDQLNKIVKILGTPDKAQWPQGYKLAQSRGYFFAEQKGVSLAQLIPDASMEAIDLIESMLKYSSRKRPTAAEILKHEYFKGVTVTATQVSGKEPIFQQKPAGAKLDTMKQDKNIDMFRATKQKFKQTRRHDAMDSNLFKQIDQIQNNRSGMGEGGDDIDSILQYLQNKKKDKNNKLPLISTKQKFYKPPEKKELRQSKTQLKHGEYKYYEKDDWKNIKNNPHQFQQKEKAYNRDETSGYKKIISNPLNPIGSLNSIMPASKKESLPPNKFSYSFQPAMVPSYLPVSKSNNKTTNLGVGLGFLPLPKPNSLLKKDLIPLGYKI